DGAAVPGDGDPVPEAGGGAGAGAGRRRLLVLRALGLGDLLAGVPARRARRRGFPGHELVMAAPAGLAPVAGATGAVDRLLPASAPGRAVPAALDWTGPPPRRRRRPARQRAAQPPPAVPPAPGPAAGLRAPRHPRHRGPALVRRGTRTGPLVPPAALVRHRRR